MENLIKNLSKIQKELKAPKGQVNKFGNYKYRSCEDILEAVKPLLGGLVLTITDDIVLVGTRYYVKAIARITDGKDEIQNTAYARETEDKKGMDASQITGASSSYARKYALNGLFLIDDTKDADTDENPAERKIEPQDTLERIGFCTVCGEQGIKAKTKTGRMFNTCPNWAEHRKNGEKITLKLPDSRTPEEKAFQEELDKIQ